MRFAHLVTLATITIGLFSGCTQDREKDLGQGFRLVDRRPTVIAPHMLSIGEESTSLYSMIDGKSEEIIRERNVSPTMFDGGALIVGDHKILIYQPGKRVPVELTHGWCPSWMPSRDHHFVICAGIGEKIPLDRESARDATAVSVHVTRFALDGRIASQYQVIVPAPAAGGCNGGNVQGTKTREEVPIIVFECLNSEGKWNMFRFAAVDPVRLVERIDVVPYGEFE